MKSVRRFVAIFITAGLLMTGSFLSAQESGLTIDVSQPQGAINPYVYGTNYGPWGMVSMDMQASAASAGITHFRFPAGNWGDQFDLTRQQLDLFMLQANAWGAEVSISVRLRDGTPEKAAELVRYANIEKGYGIRYWSIGNEPDLYRDYTVDQFNREWRAIALAMEAVDPTILLIGPEVSQFPSTVEGNDYLNVRREWVRSFLTANGDMVDIVSIHRYPFPPTSSSPPTTVEDLLNNAPEADILIENLRAVILDAVGHEMPMAVTEINSDWTNVIGGEASPDSFYNAIWWADVLGRFVRQQVEIVNHFAFVSHGDVAGGLGLMGRFETRPTYYVYPLYSQLTGERVFTASDDPEVTLTAALRDDGRLAVVIVNRSLEARSLPLILNGAQTVGDAEVWRFDRENQAEPIAGVALQNGSVLDLPAASVTLYLAELNP